MNMIGWAPAFIFGKTIWSGLVSMPNKTASGLIPSNRNMGEDDFDFKARELDCSVIRYACALSKKEYDKPFDSVRAAFIEGSPIYEGARFFSENHIQIAVINPNCIKGIFLPRQEMSVN